MVWPDSFEPRALDEPLPSEATQSRRRIIGDPLLRDSRISLGTGDNFSVASEIERILEQVLEQVLLATSATAAAIALTSENGMVCRAAIGPNAPDVGVHLDVSSGLSGACVRTREIQYCADTEQDPRANAAASRRMKVRSVLVVPILEQGELWGVFEIFSPHAGAFGNRDLQNLQTLTQVVVENLRSLAPAMPPEPVVPPEAYAFAPAVEQSPPPALTFEPAPVWEVEVEEPDEPLFALRIPPPEEEKPIEQVAATVSAPIPGWPSTQPQLASSIVLPANVEPSKLAREWGTSLLTAAVITVAVILGWTVGRPSWQKVTGQQKAQDGACASGPTDADDGSPISKGNDRAVERPDNSMRPAAARTAKGKQDGASGGLVIYQNGKVIFRQTARTGPQGQASAALMVPQPASEVPERVAAIFLSPETASARVTERIEPIYPDSALQMHIQGEVELEALIGKNGSVEQLKLVNGDSLLAAAAADAVRRWRFRPYQSDGQAVEFSTRISVDFRLP